MLQSMELQRFGHDRATEQRLPPPEKNEIHGAGELHFPTKEKTMKTHFCCEVVKEKTPVSAEEPPSASGRSSAFSLASGTSVRTQLCLFSRIWDRGPLCSRLAHPE